MDPNTFQPLISDWRAPIANLYYENSGPTKNLTFEAPSGVREGDLIQKDSLISLKHALYLYMMLRVAILLLMNFFYLS